MQRWWCRGGAEVVQRWCSSGAEVQMCADVVKRLWCRDCAVVVGGEVVQRWCRRGAGAEEQVQRCRGAEIVQMSRFWCSGAGAEVAELDVVQV